MSKPKILFICNDLSVKGGTGMVTSFLSRSLKKEYEVAVLSIDGKVDYKVNNINQDLKYYSLGLDTKLRLRDHILKGFFPLRKIIKREKFDLYILIGTYGALESMYPLHYCQHQPVIYCDHGTLSTLYEHPDRAKLLHKLSTWFDQTVVLLPKIKELYAQKTNVSLDKITVIPNPINDFQLSLRKEYKADSKRIITVGRLDPYKGLDLLTEVGKLVLPKHPDWTWDFYGEGPYHQKFQNDIDSKGLTKQMIIKGQVDNLNQIYPKYALNVLGSRREGLPLVLLEAKAFGIPSISFDIETGPSDVIKDGVNGYLIKPFEVKEMADKINYLIDSPDVRKQFSNNTLIDLNFYKEETVISKWKTLINSITYND